MPEKKEKATIDLVLDALVGARAEINRHVKGRLARRVGRRILRLERFLGRKERTWGLRYRDRQAWRDDRIEDARARMELENSEHLLQERRNVLEGLQRRADHEQKQITNLEGEIRRRREEGRAPSPGGEVGPS